MIYSTGIDMVEISRVERVFKSYGERFLIRNYSTDEIENLNQKRAGKIQSIAGKFAAKEAVMKALGEFFESGVRLKDIEILNSLSGAPYVRLPKNIVTKINS